MKKTILFFSLLLVTVLGFAIIINIPADQTTIQAGINVAANGDTLLVQPGIYYENINYNGKNIAVTSLFLTTQDTSYISSTIIDGNQSGSVVTVDSGEDSTAVLSGFTITNGNTYSLPGFLGGGIHCESSDPILQNLIIISNTGNQGGGIKLDQCETKIINVIISQNNAYHGGGIICTSANLTLENVLFTNNNSGYGGGGIHVSGGTVKLINTTFYGNSADNYGGGLFSSAGSTDISNSIFFSNSSSNGNEIYVEGGTVSTSYSNIEGSYTGTGNINADPLFVDPVNYDFHLTEDSPCIDTGDPTSPFDPDGTITDMGTYYYNQNQPSADFSSNLNNGTSPLVIDFSDQSIMGLSGNQIIEWFWDFDNDGVIDSQAQNPQWIYHKRGNYNVSLTVFDGYLENTETKEDYIELLNSAPVIQNPINDFSFDEDTSNLTIDLNTVFVDPDLLYGDELSFSHSGNSNIQVDIVNGLVALTPAPDWFGTENITFTATDDQNDSVSDEVAITINPINDPPILSITGTFEADEDLPSQAYDFSGFCSQTFGETDNLTLSADNSTHIDVTITDFDVVFESNTLNWNGTEDITFYLDDNVADRRNSRDVVEQTISVTVNPFDADFEADVTSGLLPLEVNFTDLSIPIQIPITSWQWDFENDGIIDSYLQNPTHTYSEAGLYTVSLTVSDGVNEDTEIKEDYITVVEPLNADFEADITEGDVPLEVNFTDFSTGNIIGWMWDFDNNGTIDSNEQNPVYIYENVGVYTVSLIVSDVNSEDTEIKVDYIEVTGTGSQNTIIPNVTYLFQNYPNPFNPSTTIRYDLCGSGLVQIDIFNIKGQKIITLVDQVQTAGNKSVVWNGLNENGSKISSGSFVYKLVFNGKVHSVKKCIMLK